MKKGLVIRLAVAGLLGCAFTVIVENGRIVAGRGDVEEEVLRGMREEVKREMKTEVKIEVIPTRPQERVREVATEVSDKIGVLDVEKIFDFSKPMSEAACDAPPSSFTRVMLSHKRKRKDEYTPVEFLQKLRKISEDPTSGVALYVAPNTSIPTTQNAVPIYSTHNGQYDLTSHWGDKSLWKDLRWGRDEGTPSFMPAQPDLWVAVVDNAWVYQGNVYSCQYAFSTGACLWEMGLKRVKEGGTYKTAGKILALCDSWCKGFFHFTHEHLPRVAAAYHMLVADPEVKITVPTDRSFVTSFMSDVLKIAENRLISSGSTYHAPRVFYPQPQACGNTYTHTLRLLRSIVFKLHGLPSRHNFFEKSREVFNVVLAERAGGKSGKSRMPTNYEEVKAKLGEKYKEKVLFESSLGKNALEQVKIFNKAHMVIGPHGANLANIMWMQQGGTVVEFMSYRYGNLCYYNTAQRVGLTFRFIMQPKDKGGSYSVDYDEVVKHIEDAMARAQGGEGIAFD